MTKKVKIFLAILLAASIAGMGYSFHDTGAVRKIARTLQSMGTAFSAQQDAVDLAAPHYIIAGDGSYEYKITDRNLILPDEVRVSGSADETEYSSFLAALKTIIEGGGAPVPIDEGAESTIRESFSKLSITAVFEYDVPLAEYLKYNNIKSRGAGQLTGISRVTLFADGSAALYDRHTGDYYRIAAPGQEENELQQGLEQMIRYIFDNTDSSSPRIQSITSMTGVENSALIPSGALITVGNSAFISEFSVGQEEDLNLVKAAFFPQGMDFVDTIGKADGSRILMYGTGKEVLHFGSDGKLAYYKEFRPEEYQKCGLYTSLKYAADFLSSDTWRTEELDLLDLFVNQVTPVTKQGCEGYRIDFGASVNGMEIMYENDSLLSIEIYGKQITSCIRNLPDLRGANIPDAPPEAMDGTELIRGHSDTIASVILELCSEDSSVNTEKYSANDNFYAVASSILDARIGLVRLENEPIETAENPAGNTAGDEENGGIIAGKQLVPAWYLLVDGVEFWFDAENGSLLSYEKR